MKKSIKIILIAIIIIILVLTVAWSMKSRTVPNVNTGDNGDKNITSGEHVDLSLETIKYDELTELSKEYTVEEAIADNCFVIGNEVHNKELLNEFMQKVENREDSKLRIVQTTASGDIVVSDIEFSGDIITYTEDYTRDTFIGVSNIITNSYSLNDGYVLKSAPKVLEDGTVLKMYSLDNTVNSSNSIVLFAFIEEKISNDDLRPNQFDATVKSISEGVMVVEPDETTTENDVSSEIKIMLDEEMLDNHALGQRVKVTYSGEITEISGGYQIDKVISIENL